MPLGPFGEVVGTTNTLEALGPDAANYKSKVIAPRNPKLLKGDEEENKMTPSQFMFDMQMDTEQKLANTHTMKIPRKVELLDMADTSLQKFSQVNIDEPMFQPYPSEVTFQNFEPYQVYEVPLILRNNDKVPRLVKVTQADSPYFKVISPHDVGHKVGPGLPTTFRIQFKPEEKKDYNHELVCITEREKFVVPVRAIGSRAVLDFTDNIHFPPGPVKYAHSRTYLVRNIGNMEAKFTLSTEKPFSVTPEIGTLPVQESMQVTVEYNPQKTGDHNSELVVSYDTGENVYISLYGAAQNSSVRLDKNTIKMENTYISMANQRTVTIHNRSDVICHFRWTKYNTQEQEDEEKALAISAVQRDENNDKKSFWEEVMKDPTLQDKVSILTRTFHNKKMVIDKDSMLFDDQELKIEPVEGDIWPNTSFDINVIFKPREARSYILSAFCDVTGRETFLPLRVKGEGVGPSVKFSFDTLDLGNIFIGSKHTYEIILANHGDIDAIYSVLPKHTIFGPCFTFDPSEGIVMPGGHQAIAINFTSPYLGDFEETFSFQVDGQPDQIQVKFCGTVIGPTFQFDVPRLKFGTISYGFLNTQSCTLMNTSLVPMKFTLRVPGDGIAESICGTSDLDSNRSQMGSPAPIATRAGPPKEFEILPESGILQPQSEVRITVNFISNTIKKYEMNLVVDVENVGEEILSLPIYAKCVVPPITVLSPILDYGRCFLRHPYEHSVKLHNDTDLPAKYELLTQSVNEDTPITYTSPKMKGIVEPHSLTEVPMIIQSQMLDEQDIIGQFAIFGSPDPPLPVHIACIGEGPVVHISPQDIDWGIIPVLSDRPMKVVLSNESLIPAKFTAHMVRPKSAFRVEPQEGEIGPEKRLEITVTANLDDSVRFQDKLQINFIESQVRQIPLVGYGQGTTIVSEPKLTSTFDLGPNFSNRPLKKTIMLTNKGRRHQQLVWSTDGFPSLGKGKKALAEYKPLDMKFRNVPPPQEPPRPVFKINPNRFDLPPGTSMEMNIEGFVESPKYIKERLLCHAIIGRQGGKELIMRVDLSADFISPLLEFSTKSVYFRVDKKPDDELSLQTRELKIMNVSTLPLTTGLKLKYPFQIIQDDGSETSEMEVHLDVGKAYMLRIQFDPAYKDDLHIRTIDEILHVTYKEHPHIDYIALRGEVYFPNIDFEKSVVDFGCILNDTEVTRYINITNNSPMEVHYKWSFLVGDQPLTEIRAPAKPTTFLEEIKEEEDAGGDGDAKIEVLVSQPTEEQINVDEKSEVESTKEEDIPKETEEPVQGEQEIIKEPETQDDISDNRMAPDSPRGSPTGGSPRDDEDQLEKGQLESQEAPEGGLDKNKTEDTMLSLASLRDIVYEEDPLKTNRALSQLLEDTDTAEEIGIEEVFDILPLYGYLQPGDTEQVTMTFYGHAHIWGQVKAICEIKGGPTYEIMLTGEASLVDYKFDCKEIDFGKQMYDHVASAEIKLINTGKVGFDFCGIGMDPALAKKPKPGSPIMVPHAGYIEPMSEQTLVVKYLPGAPEDFKKSFVIQVAHFEPDVVTISGTGVFPRISLDLPRTVDSEGHYDQLVQNAKDNLTKSGKIKLTERAHTPVLPSSNRLQPEIMAQGDIIAQPHEIDIQMEVENLTVKEFSHELSQHTSRPDLYDPAPPDSNESRDTQTEHKPKKKKQKPRLPEYVLDFGYVVLGTVKDHIVKASNTGWSPVSFQVEHDDIHHYGFHVELDKVKNLPGAPDHETVVFNVNFDPRGANLSLGSVETVVNINIINGPIIPIRLKANVTMPDMEISEDTLDFSDVNCGECKVITVQLYNSQHVKCEWNSNPTEKDRKADKHVPMHLRRKMRNEKQKPRHFEIMPPTGVLMPGQRLNVQVKFMPTEEKFYEQRIPIRIAQSSQRILLLCRGQGLEPRLEFEKSLVEFGPILPHSVGDEQEITIKNPCSYPIEFYNLEFDSQYLEEEKVLRLMKGYDEYNTILLPPRNSGDRLPHELLDYYDEQMKKLEESERARKEALEAAEAARKELDDGEGSEGDDKDDSDERTEAALGTSRLGSEPAGDLLDSARKEESDEAQDSASSIGVGELEITPVSAAIARHLGIDLSPEGKAARNRRGICVIVHGAPMSGKTSTAISLAKKYEAAILTVDQIVVDAISSGNTPSGMKARALCQEAARKRLEELKLLEGDEAEKKPGGLSIEQLTAHTQGTNVKGKDKHHQGSLAGAKTGINTSSIDGATGSQVPSSPPPLAAPIARRLSVSASVAGEEGLMSCVLPEDLLVEILSERLQLNDCHRGVVFDGLETLFAQNLYTTAHAILRSLNNRRFIYFISLKLDYAKLKEQEKKSQEEKERNERLKEEQDRIRLEEMSEDEYDALSEEEKAAVDRKRLDIKKERIRKEMEERMERERIEREREEEIKRIQDEEKSKKKGRKGPAKEEGKQDGKKSAAPTGPAGKNSSMDRVTKGKGGKDDDHHVGKQASQIERPESHQTEKSDSNVDDGKKGKKKDGKKDGKEKGDKEKVDVSAEEQPKEVPKESDILLMQRFRTFEHGQKDINEMLEFWDRTTLSLRRPPTPSEKSEEDQQHHPQSGKSKGKKGEKHDKEKAEKERQKQLQKENEEKAAKEAAAAQGEGQEQEMVVEEKEDDGIGLPHIVVDCSDKSTPVYQKVIGCGKFPSMEEVLDGLGMGPKGPPVPPPADFSVIPYPVKRKAPPVSEFGGRYIFIASSADDPNVGVPESSGTEPEEEKSVTPDKGKEDHTTPTKGKASKDKSGGKDTAKGERKKSAERKSTSKTEKRRPSVNVQSPPPGAVTPVSDGDNISMSGDGMAVGDSKTPKLTIFRWIVPANGEVVVRLRFQSEELGQFDQTLNFEIVGTRRRYQLFCRGVCAFPSISREPRIVFPSRKKTKKTNEICHKKYILSTETFEFGPLLNSRPRTGYKEGKHPAYMEQLNVTNTSPLEADISFCFFKDSKSETFILEPPTMLLKSGESQKLTIWAYPCKVGRIDDSIVCCIRENPEPVVFKIACDSFNPELDLNTKDFRFESVRLYRKEIRTIHMRNNTQLPVVWKVTGIEQLGDDFTLSADHGVIDPLQEYPLHAYFRAMKPLNTTQQKKIRLEIHDQEGVHPLSTENLTVHYEPYDISVDMSFNNKGDHGSDGGGLDLGIIHVGEEKKCTCALKNRGKYEVGYNFIKKDCDPANPNAASLFTITPDHGNLSSADRPTQPTIIFKSDKELVIKDQPILSCQVIDLKVGDEGEIIGVIPIKVSAKVLFPKYEIQPANDINFGSLLINNKKEGQSRFEIHNRGEFDFKFIISKMQKEDKQAGGRGNRPQIPELETKQRKEDKNYSPVKDSKRSKSRDGSSSGRSVAKPKKTDSVSDYNASQVMLAAGISRAQMSSVPPNAKRGRAEGGAARQQFGMFIVSPTSGTVIVGGSITINVDCITEQEGKGDEEICIDVVDRDPNDHPGGIPYRLLAEVCIPSISTIEQRFIGSIFEEHRIVKNLSIWQHSNQGDLYTDGGVYAEDENKFIFNNVIIGRKAKARFKICNTNKVMCDVVFSVKPTNVKRAGQNQDIFEVDPPRAQISHHSHVYATVTFTPPSMQNFTAQFEAALEGQTKGKSLIFEVAGDGNLPRITVQKPTMRNKMGQTILLFKKNLVGRTQILPFTLINDGTLPSKVDLDLMDPDNVFKIRPGTDTNAVMENDYEDTKRPHTASVSVGVGEVANFNVIFKPSSVQRSQAHIKLTVIDNQYEDSIIQMVGEGYEDEITLDNIHSVSQPFEPEVVAGEDSALPDDDIAAAKPNLINFGDIYVNESCTLSFSMTNNSKTDVYRLQWPENANLKFTPTLGHLHPNSSKDVTVSFKSDAAKTLTEQAVNCKVTKIKYDKPIDQIAAWDDRIKTVKWVDLPSSPQPSESGSKAPLSSRGAKKKVVETEPEPTFTDFPDTSRNVELLVSANADFSKFGCKTESVHFKDTLMFQTRVFEFNLSNKGSIKMDYNWQVLMENMAPSLTRAVTFMSEGERPESRIDAVDASYIPFSVEPEFGTIAAGKKQRFTVKFSPLDVNTYEGRLICTIPNLEKDIQGPVVGLKGKSLMPYCHFELQDSDYITGARRDPELPGPGDSTRGTTLDPNTRVIEFSCVGVGVKKTLTFGVVNPTNKGYSFEWICEDRNDDTTKVSPFKCVTMEGLIKSGKRFPVTFEFTSMELDTVESFWRFVIPDQNISVPFLLVGKAREPDIAMDRSHMNFKALLIGHAATESVYIINNEDEAFSYVMEQDSCHSAGFSAHIQVEPMTGIIPPKSRAPIQLYFAPNSDKEVNFNIICKVKRKVTPVTLNVKAEGYSMNSTLLCEDSQGRVEELICNGMNIIRFGEVEVNEQQIRNLTIINSGKFNFDYEWEMNMSSQKKDMVSITPGRGGVLHGEKAVCRLVFCPPSRTTLKDCELVLKIKNGPTYSIGLEGLGVTPGLHFSFQSYNFGNCFIYKAGMPDRNKVLKLTNKDRKDISVNCLYVPTDHLHHNFKPCVIPSGQSIDVLFTFYPREARVYKEQIVFEINGLSRNSVTIIGTGTEMKIEVPESIINLGSLVVGGKLKKPPLVPVVNNSPAPITFKLALTPTTLALQQTNALSITPTENITLEGKGGTCNVIVKLNNKHRIPQFTEEVYMECAGHSQPLFAIKGCVLGMEINLDTTAIPFGSVFKNSSTSKKIVMTNTGDMNAKFTWDIKRFRPDFNIYPVEGYITPGMEVTFEVTFEPKQEKKDIRYDNLQCFIDGGIHKPVTLTLTGSCTAINPRESQSLHPFMVPVREEDTKTITVRNGTNQSWLLRPIITGDQWSGSTTFKVDAMKAENYAISYKPVKMTHDGIKDTGSIFFPTPDGSGLFWTLTGTAEAPKPIIHKPVEVPCKVWYTELLPVNNWLKQPQRFKVTREDMKKDASTSIEHMHYLDVPASGSKDFKLAMYFYKEGATQMKITFTNEKSGEYVVYDVSFKAIKPNIMGTIDLSTPVRKTLEHKITLENPLDTPVTFSVTCPSEIQIPSQFVVQKGSKHVCTFSYLPLKVGETSGKIEFTSNDLGTYTYEVNLKATPAGPEKALYFHCCLGNNQVSMAKFLNFSKQTKPDYTCKVDNHHNFHVDKNVAAVPGSVGGTDVSVDVTFEPSQLGEHKGILTISSPTSGEYIFPLYGTCVAAKPQGPFIIKSGQTTNIPFRNVFHGQTSFTYQVDNELFYVTKQSDTVRGPRDQRIGVGFHGNDSGSKAQVMGKLIVTCLKSAGGTSNAQWVFYLKGVTP
ncbi:hydrocephalus-inducing protein homolog isoform X10 [Mytilus edulis]|uniref:hydrocephalus-inducing protein homolog isoform X10 n=1 Tax=Mytilus edulis TaxID=6550 RepID=UPI0039EF1ABB